MIVPFNQLPASREDIGHPNTRVLINLLDNNPSVETVKSFLQEFSLHDKNIILNSKNWMPLEHDRDPNLPCDERPISQFRILRPIYPLAFLYAFTSNFKLMNLLIAEGASLDTLSRNDSSLDMLFIRACCADTVAHIHFLLHHKASVNARDPVTGCSALHYAASLRQDSVVRYLLEHAKIDRTIRSMHEVPLEDESGNVIDTIPKEQDYKEFAASYQAAMINRVEQWIMDSSCGLVFYPNIQGGQMPACTLSDDEPYGYPGIDQDKLINEMAMRLLKNDGSRFSPDRLQKLINMESLPSDATLEAYRKFIVGPEDEQKRVAEGVLNELETARNDVREKMSIWDRMESVLRDYMEPLPRDITHAYIGIFTWRRMC